MAPDVRLDLRQLDPLVHAHFDVRQVRRQGQATARALLRSMIDNPVGFVTERPAVAFMPRLGAARLGVCEPACKKDPG